MNTESIELRKIDYDELFLMFTRLMLKIREYPNLEIDIAEFIRQENFRRNLFVEKHG